MKKPKKKNLKKMIINNNLSIEINNHINKQQSSSEYENHLIEEAQNTDMIDKHIDQLKKDENQNSTMIEKFIEQVEKGYFKN
jgi:uncharacterized protein YpiB (UPF0302 family)